MPDLDFQPDAAYFDTMARHARSHWWYDGRRALVRDTLRRFEIPEGRVLDVGCGTGDNMDMLTEVSGVPVVGTDLSAYALRHAARGRTEVALAEALPVASATCGLVTSMDVVEHLDDDLVGLREYRRVLGRRGLLLLTVPAYEWLWGEHDVRAAHRRRYRVGTLRSAVDTAGFDVLHTTYYNSFLVPPAALLRRTPLRRIMKSTDEEVGDSSALVSRVMRALARLERPLALRGLVPFGLSILLVGRRRDERVDLLDGVVAVGGDADAAPAGAAHEVRLA